MCEFHESTCNGLGDIWWTDNPIYFSSIDVKSVMLPEVSCDIGGDRISNHVTTLEGYEKGLS